MNKKLRRLLGRRKTTDDNQNKTNKGKLPSLLSQRFNAAPNYYFKGDDLNRVNLNDDLILEKEEVADPKVSGVVRKPVKVEEKVPDEIVIQVHNTIIETGVTMGPGCGVQEGLPPISPTQTHQALLRHSNPHTTESRVPVNQSQSTNDQQASNLSPRDPTSSPETKLPMTSSNIPNRRDVTDATSPPVTSSVTRKNANTRDVTPRHDSVNDCDWGWVSMSGFPPESPHEEKCSHEVHHHEMNQPPNKRVLCDLHTSCSHGDRWMTQPRCHHQCCQVYRQCCPNKRTATDAFSSCEHCDVTSSIFFTISDEDIATSRPRVLEFGSSIHNGHCDVAMEPHCCIHGSLHDWSRGRDLSDRRTHCLHHNHRTHSHVMPPSLAFRDDVINVARQPSPFGQSSCCRRVTSGVRDNQTFENNHVTGRNFRETGKRHFHLSQKSYAKLIAFCESRKILSAIPSRGWNQYSAGNFSPDHRRTPTLSPIHDHEKANEVCRLARVFSTVEECTWYWGGMSGQEAKRKLRGSSPGTFLLRDSADPRYLYSLSLMTKSGPTSIRIVYNNGRFRFDSERDDVTNESRQSQTRSDIDRRSCVVHMVLRYTSYLRQDRNNEHCCVNNTNSPSPPSEGKSERGQFMCYWVDQGGRREIPVLLTHPLHKKTISLQHLTRICLNKNYRFWENPSLGDSLPLPIPMKNYIKRYPYPV
nr:suppressor of cytokine signaling isoform X1 [Ciona intestinalis]|eukprot:XP_009861817.1 suppressor of cytokine signaling isoform X1 [Ciona intestinalis]